MFDAANLTFGHGTASARDEAGWLVFAVAGIDHARGREAYVEPLGADQRARIAALAGRRIGERIPLAYLLNEAWFAGLRFYVNDAVLVPRSPLAELIVDGFSPWLADEDLARALDIGTGSGCIAIALAHYFPQLEVDASDVSAEALAVAESNVAAHTVTDRVHLRRSDIFDGFSADEDRYDLIISNPPYVDAVTMTALPPEYRHEPSLGLQAGQDGWEFARRILVKAHHFLTDRGILVVETGDAEAKVPADIARLPLVWLEMNDGASGIFVVTRDDLLRNETVLSDAR